MHHYALRMTHDALSQNIPLFLDAMRYASGLSEASCAAYRRDLIALAKAMVARGHTTWTTVTTNDLQTWLIDLHKAHYAPTTIHRRAAAMRRFFLWLLDEGLIPASPADGITLGKGERRRLPKVVAEAPLNTLIEAVDCDDFRDVRDRAILEILYGCGLRVTELCTLRLQDIDLSAQRIRVHGKGNKERTLPFGAPAKAALKHWFIRREAFLKGYKRDATLIDLTRPAAPLFLSPTAKPLNRGTVAKIVHERIHAYLPPDSQATPHTLRHSFATHLLDHGAPLIDIRNLLGHASIDTTQIYTHTSTQSLKETFKRCFPRK